jgi:hypothetical protein
MLFTLLPVILAQTAALHLPSLDPRRLTPGSTSGIIYAVHGRDTVEAGGYVEELTVDTTRVVLVRTTITEPAGQVVDTMVHRLPDLRPLMYSETSRKVGSMHVTFQGTRATGWSRGRDGDSTGIDAPIPAGAWDIPSLVLVVEASDLADGTVFSFPAFYPSGDGGATIDAAVTGAEAVRRRSCWVVQVTSAGDSVGTFWIDQETHLLRRSTLSPSPGVSLVLEAAR